MIICRVTHTSIEVAAHIRDEEGKMGAFAEGAKLEVGCYLLLNPLILHYKK